MCIECPVIIHVEGHKSKHRDVECDIPSAIHTPVLVLYCNEMDPMEPQKKCEYPIVGPPEQSRFTKGSTLPAMLEIRVDQQICSHHKLRSRTG